jgi:hypothetical protein
MTDAAHPPQKIWLLNSGALDDTVIALWCGGRDTLDIAQALGVPEAEVANRLPKVLERRRAVNQTARDFWDEARIGQLRALHAEGLSFVDIAQRMGVTRSAALGKAYRLGITTGVRTVARRVRLPAFTANLDQLAREPRPSPLPAECFGAPLPASQPCGLLDLTTKSCRWPLWNDDRAKKLFCGAVTDDGPYCPTHRAIAVPARSLALASAA